MSESHGDSIADGSLLTDASSNIAVPQQNSLGDAHSYNVLARVLHWLMAVLIVAMLFLGAALIGTIGNYGVLLSIHRTVGFAILALAVVRVVNRLLRRGPAPGAGLPQAERVAAVGSEVMLYVLFILQPLLGWALVSASGIPVRVAGGLRLPALAPENARLYSVLHLAHTWLAYLLLALFIAHMSAVLWHTVALRDGLLRRMLWTRRSASSDQRATSIEPRPPRADLGEEDRATDSNINGPN